MLRVFQDDVVNPDHFTVTLELVPGRESSGRAVDTIMGIAKDAYSDGRISAVSITDNPGGNPSLSPDVLGYQIFQVGMDVIVHFTCRDMNRVGMESRALQLGMMGMKNILAISGDYSGKGFGGQGAPVFDLDSVHLQILFEMLNERMFDSGDPDGFFPGCAVSPFKQTVGECFAQYAKLCRKVAAGAEFVITQLGYDWRKYEELIKVMRHMRMNVPALGSVYMLTPFVARIMNAGQVPGVVVSNDLCRQVHREWADKKAGRKASIERTARLGAVLRGIGYRGIHIGGIHKSFESAGLILDRIEAIGDQWRDFLPEFNHPQPDGFYLFNGDNHANALDQSAFGNIHYSNDWPDQLRYRLLKGVHQLFFNSKHPLAPQFRRLARYLDNGLGSRVLIDLFEHPAKAMLLGCKTCGDCGIQHVGFLCPESQCPKHTRNGACGGSRGGFCEVFPGKQCVWFRAHRRLAHDNQAQEMVHGCVPPRMWELDQSSSWLNFHLDRDHQSTSSEIAFRCRMTDCHL